MTTDRHIALVAAGYLVDPTTTETTPAERDDLRDVLDALGLLSPRLRPRRRRPARTRTAPPTPGARCGTRAGYKAHLYRGERPCAPCVEGRRAYDQAYRRHRWVPAPTREPQPCGTQAAYQRHHLRGERPCAACTEANRISVRARRAKARARRAAA